MDTDCIYVRSFGLIMGKVTGYKQQYCFTAFAHYLWMLMLSADKWIRTCTHSLRTWQDCFHVLCMAINTPTASMRQEKLDAPQNIMSAKYHRCFQILFIKFRRQSILWNWDWIWGSCCFMIASLSKDIWCYEWPYSFLSLQITTNASCHVQTGDCMWTCQSSLRVCVDMYGLTYSLYQPW